VPSFGADINECTEGLHNCTKSGPCVNIVGSYICNYTVNGRDVTHTAVWAVTGTLLILLLAVGIVTATAYRLHNRYIMVLLPQNTHRSKVYTSS
jgi:hypothetical protein